MPPAPPAEAPALPAPPLALPADLVVRLAGHDDDGREPPAPEALEGAVGGQEHEGDEAEAVDGAEDVDGVVGAVDEREVDEHDQEQGVGDADGDGLSNHVEFVVGSNAFAADSDADDLAEAVAASARVLPVAGATKPALSAPPAEAMVPQLHAPGEEAEVDFGELMAVIAGEVTKLWLFSLRLSCSGRACHRIFATQAQEAFLAGHIDAFERLQGVPFRIRYDNLKPAVARVLLGRERIESERFVCFRSHYGFDAFYCRPGKDGAHEKGGVEGDVGFFRRNHLVPVPTADSLVGLNEAVRAGDEEDLGRIIEGRRATIRTEFAAEQAFLQPLPGEVFDATVQLSARVDQKSRVPVRQCRYSVPTRLIGRRVEVRLGAEELTIFDKGRLVARHDRLVHRGEESLVLDHYLEALVRKPGALASSAPLGTARASGAFSADHEAYWAAARRALGDKAGTRALIAALLLERSLPATAVRAAMRAGVALGSFTDELVALAEVVGAPQARDHPRWPWTVEIGTLLLVPVLDAAPPVEAIGVAARSMSQQSHIRITEEHYRRALEAIASVASAR